MGRNTTNDNAKDQPQVGGDNSEAPVEVPANQCPDCKGVGIRNPSIDRQVCPTCEGRGTIV